MLCANTMPSSNDSALKQREGGFRGVCVHIANGVDTILVLDGLVLTEDPSLSNCARISAEVVRHNHVNIVGNVLLNVLRQSIGVHIFGVKEAQFAAALPDADYHLFPAFRMPDLVPGAPGSRPSFGR